MWWKYDENDERIGIEINENDEKYVKKMEKMMENNERKWLEGVSCSPGVFTFLPVRKLLDYQ